MTRRWMPAVLVALAAAILGWRLSRPSPRTLAVAVHEGRVALETGAGNVEVPAGMGAEAAPGAMPRLVAGPVPDAWRWPLASALAEEEEPAWKRALREKLKQTIHYKFAGVPFKFAKEYIETQGQVVINVDKPARDAVPGLDDMPIHLSSPEKGMTLESALKFLTRAVSLEWTLRDGFVIITTQEGAKEPPVQRTYDVGDLLGKPEDFKHDGASLVDFLKRYADPEAWKEAGNSLVFEKGKLLVRAEPGTQKRVADVLRDFREAPTRPPTTAWGTGMEEPAWKSALRKELKQKVHFKFAGVPFKDAREYFETQGRVVINVDKLAYDATPGLDEVPVTLASPEEGMTLESALNFLTRAVSLEWTLRDELITVTTEEGLKQPAVLLQHDVRSLLRAGSSPEDLVRLVKEAAGPAAWEDPSCSVEYRIGRLYVDAPSDAHEAIVERLNALYRARVSSK